jgi:hypothetical protein
MVFQSLFKGWTGELKTNLTQKLLLDSKQYHIFNNVLIQKGTISTQIDHVIVSRYGLFVVETKNRSGWIFGSVENDNWTQSNFGKKTSFQNPLRQNYRHTKSLSEFLGIPHNKIHSLVVFWGDCEFKTPMPDNVIHGFFKYQKYIKSKNTILFTDDEVNRICEQLSTIKNQTPFLSGFHHTRSLKKRYASTTICPKCGGNLIERKAYKGIGAGNKFLGCENYPRCKYTKALD